MATLTTLDSPAEEATVTKLAESHDWRPFLEKKPQPPADSPLSWWICKRCGFFQLWYGWPTQSMVSCERYLMENALQ